MKIEHIAIWCKDIERLREFYEKSFSAKAGPRYRNEAKGFESYFLKLEEGARIELMSIPNVVARSGEPGFELSGLAHIALSTGSKEAVDQLTKKLTAAGCELLDGPRTTGDGYYESVILDPENNKLEITV